MGRDDDRPRRDRGTRGKGPTGQPPRAQGRQDGFAQGSLTGGSEADLGLDDVDRRPKPERRDC